MKRAIILFFLVMLFVACGGSKPIRDWVNISHSQMETFKNHALTGRTQTADVHFKKAIEEIKKSGNIDLLAKAYLTKMAVQTALSEETNADDFLRVDAVESFNENKSYYFFLAGEFERVDEKVLPAVYRPLQNALRKGQAFVETQKLLDKIDDPLSRLIAAGIFVRTGKADEAVLRTAVDTASEQGWKKALILYLGRLRSYYDQKGQTAKAAAVRARLALIE